MDLPGKSKRAVANLVEIWTSPVPACEIQSLNHYRPQVHTAWHIAATYFFRSWRKEFHIVVNVSPTFQQVFFFNYQFSELHSQAKKHAKCGFVSPCLITILNQHLRNLNVQFHLLYLWTESEPKCKAWLISLENFFQDDQHENWFNFLASAKCRIPLLQCTYPEGVNHLNVWLQIALRLFFLFSVTTIACQITRDKE